MNIIQMLIPEKVKPKYLVNGKHVTFPMAPEYITIHETANTAKGANDLAHANLQKNGNSRQATWHLQVDEDSCYQSLPFNEAGIHAGDGANGTGNRKSIGIEICVNSDGDFDKAVVNAAKVTAKLMTEFNIPSSKIVPHRHWSGKNCPTNLLKNGWKEFINLCTLEVAKLERNKKELAYIKTGSMPIEEAEKRAAEIQKKYGGIVHVMKL
jgi:N-acetylmuramoyl-L-alanine amidase CwlA